MNRSQWPIVALIVAAVGSVIFATILVQGGLLVPLALAAVFLSAVLRHLATRFAFTLLIVGPVLGSTVQLGSLTLDNYLTLAGIAYGIFGLLDRRPREFPRWALLPLLVALSCGVSAVATSAGVPMVMVRFLGVSLIPILAYSATRPELEFMKKALYATLALGAGSVLQQPLTHIPAPVIVEEGAEILRFGGLFGHPNFGAYALGLTVLYLLQSTRLTFLRVAFIALAGACLLLMGSLTALVMVVLIASVTWLKTPGRFAVVVMVATLLTILLGETLVDRLDYLGSSDQNSLTWRFGHWREVLALPNAGGAFGMGWGGVTELSESGLGAHNAYLQVYAELGWFGTASLVAALLVVARELASRRARPLRTIWAYVLSVSLMDPVLLYPSTITVLLSVSALHCASWDLAGPAVQPPNPRVGGDRWRVRRDLRRAPDQSDETSPTTHSYAVQLPDPQNAEWRHPLIGSAERGGTIQTPGVPDGYLKDG